MLLQTVNVAKYVSKQKETAVSLTEYILIWYIKKFKDSHQHRWVQQGHEVLGGLEDPGNIKKLMLLSSFTILL